MEYIKVRIFCENCGMVTGGDIEYAQRDTAHPDLGRPMNTEENEMEYELWRCTQCTNGIYLGISRKEGRLPQSSFR